MSKFVDQLHNRKGDITEYRNRVDLDSALKERGINTELYPQGSEERKELHRFLIKRASNVGNDQAIREVRGGKMFNQKDMSKI